MFSFESPEGYSLHVQQRNYVTEQEMIEYIGILADVSDKTFPGWKSPDQLSLGVEREKKIYRTPEKERTAAERKFVEVVDRCVRKNLNCLPVFHFITDSVVKNSFQYVGKGVKLGDKAAIVCWYKLKDAKDPNTYRVVYGDLSVKDVATEDLPLPVGP